MENTKKASEELSITGKMLPKQLQQFAQKGFKEVSLKKLRGGFFLIIGYLLSPLCWWNDLVFNLPVSYCFGYICSWLSPDLLLPGLILGYWLSNIVGILLMQAGAVDVLQQAKERNLKKELLAGIATSTVYTLAIVALIQFKILDAPF